MKTSKRKDFNWSKGIVIGLIIITLITILLGVILSMIIPKEKMTTYELLSILLSAYSSLSLILLVIQLILFKQDAKNRHDEKRREKTVDYMIKWSESLGADTTYAIRIVETFNHQQCTNLYNNTPFKVDYKTKKKLCAICSRYLKDTCNNCLNENPKSNFVSENKNRSVIRKIITGKEELYTVDVTQCAEIRWYVIKYLNHLEALLISWKEGIVDREIIEEQFQYLYNPISGKDTLQSFRNVAGNGKSYPTIEEFCLQLRNKRQQTNNKFKELL